MKIGSRHLKIRCLGQNVDTITRSLKNQDDRNRTDEDFEFKLCSVDFWRPVMFKCLKLLNLTILSEIGLAEMSIGAWWKSRIRLLNLALLRFSDAWHGVAELSSSMHVFQKISVSNGVSPESPLVLGQRFALTSCGVASNRVIFWREKNTKKVKGTLSVWSVQTAQ